MTIDEIVSDSGLERVAPGGSAFYTSIAASFLGVDVSVVSSLGIEYPQDALDWMVNRNVNLRRVEKTALASTRFRLLYERGHRDVRLLNPGSRISQEALIGNQDIIHLGPVYHEIDPEVA